MLFCVWLMQVVQWSEFQGAFFIPRLAVQGLFSLTRLGLTITKKIHLDGLTSKEEFLIAPNGSLVLIILTLTLCTCIASAPH